MGPPVIFKQKRPGLNEKIFSIFKFRSLTNQKDERGNLLPDVNRLSKYGLFIRSSSLDELPQLFNILKGEMSFVGPRPLRVEYLEYYSDQQKKRHLIKPGITGLTQVNARNSISWEEKFKMDVFYVKNTNFMLDLYILSKTIFVILLRKNISSNNDGTNIKFSKKL
tara:strand:+ start:58 stop:555 length:498 start_codon:yes stop_codon:yes gene_type:complete